MHDYPDWLDDGYVLTVTDVGCYACGWVHRLPSGWCTVEIAVWYRGAH